MRLNQRRPTSSPVNPFCKVTKSDLVFELERRGLRLSVETENRGEWNESRVFYADKKSGAGTRLGAVMKGERPDWNDMFDRVLRKC